MSPGPDFRGADRERCVSYFTLLWWSKKALSAMAGRRKRPVRCSRKLRQSSSAVATSRAGHRWPRLNLEVPYRRWEWALRRAHRELSWWSLRSLIRLSWFPGTAMYISGTNALRFRSLRPPRFASARKSRWGWKNSAPRDSPNGIYGISDCRKSPTQPSCSRLE